MITENKAAPDESKIGSMLIRMPLDLRQALKVIAAKRNRTMSELVILFIRRGMDSKS